MTLFLAIGSFPAIFLAHLLYERIWAKKFPPLSRQKAVAILAVLISFFCAVVTLVSRGWLEGLYVFIVSLGFAHVYFHIFNMSETARRIRILTSVYAAQKEGAPSPLPRWEGVGGRVYAPDGIIKERIERLQAMRAIELKEGKFVTRFHPLLIATMMIDQYKRLFR